MERVLRQGLLTAPPILRLKGQLLSMSCYVLSASHINSLTSQGNSEITVITLIDKKMKVLRLSNLS